MELDLSVGHRMFTLYVQRSVLAQPNRELSLPLWDILWVTP
jgi:hypothetical protein